MVPGQQGELMLPPDALTFLIEGSASALGGWFNTTSEGRLEVQLSRVLLAPCCLSAECRVSSYAMWPAWAGLSDPTTSGVCSWARGRK